MYKRLRIVRDFYAGFVVEEYLGWWRGWREVGNVNTHHTLEEARAYAKTLKEPHVVEYL